MNAVQSMTSNGSGMLRVDASRGGLPFPLTRVPERKIQSLLPTGNNLKSGDTVLQQRTGRRVSLVAPIASGGEGTVYKTDLPGVVCKVYHHQRLTTGAQRKIALMEGHQMSHPAICWPMASVTDSQGVFRGFLMPSASGEPLAHGLFIPTAWLSKHRSWTRRQSVGLALRILEGIHHLNRLGVLLGDINPMNILVKDENTVYFVDCDSYQVAGFPCPVGAVNFVAPEIQGQDFGEFLRTPEHELFAVATLLFMILMPGKPPYSHRGGSDGAANIQKMHFPYPLGERSADGAPGGAWRFCWSHLTRQIKEAFYRSFHADYRGQPRVSVAKWLGLLNQYKQVLDRPGYTFVGPQPQYGFDLSILPENFRYIEGMGRELPTDGVTDMARAVQRMASTSASMAPRKVSSERTDSFHQMRGPTPRYIRSPQPRSVGPVAALLRMIFS